MTNVALIMRPWIITMRKYAGVSCYLLADDVLAIGTGMKMLSKFAGALNATHRYLHHMGPRLHRIKVIISPARWLPKSGWRTPGGKA